MMRNLKYTAAFAAAVLFAVLSTACTDDPAEPAEPTEPNEPTEQSGDLPIRWDVKGVASSSDATRVMIGNDGTDETGGTGGTGGTSVKKTCPMNPEHPDFYVTLQEVCSAPKLTGSEGSYDRDARFAIGLFGDYTYKNENNEDVTENDFYRGARLVYLPDEPQTPTGAFKGWDTNVALKYWHPGAKYIFRAYYPQRLHGYTVSTSDATTLALVYPSRKLQYDLLLGVAPVTATTEQMKNAVALEMEHALAALRFQFKLNFEDADLLTSVYLLSGNDEVTETNYFSQGTALFGAQIDKKNDKEEDIIKKLHKIEWLHDYEPPADEVLYKWVPPLKYWYGEDLNGDGKIGNDFDGDGVIELDGKDLDGDDVIEMGYKDLDGDGKYEIGVGKDTNGDGIIDEYELGVGKVNDKGVFEFETEELPADYMLAKWGWNHETGMPNGEIPEKDDVLDPIPEDHRDRDKPNLAKFNPVLMYSYVEKPKTTEGGIGAQATVYKNKYANAYYGTELYYDRTGTDPKWVRRTPADPDDKEIDFFASDEADEVAFDGKLYCRNSGWLLIPPQGSFGKLTLCFTTKRGGRTLYKVKLPVDTGTEIDKDGAVIVGSDGKPVTDKDGTPAWAAGYRYTYLVTISESDYTVNVSIQDWNERKHSTEIIF